MVNPAKNVGVFLILIAILANPFLIPYVIGETIESLMVNAAIIVFEIIMLAIGVAAYLRPGWFAARKTDIIKLVFSFVICASLIFIMLTVIHPDYHRENWVDVDTRFDSVLGWESIANSSVLKYGGKLITTNSLGFRSGEVDYSKRRIVMIGDSVTWGWGVNDNETSSYYLQKNMGDDFQVINLAVPGYGIQQYYLRLKKYIDVIKPEMVIVIIYPGSDFYNTINDNWYGRNQPLFIADDGRLKLVNPNISMNSCMNYMSSSLLVSIPFSERIINFICNNNVNKTFGRNVTTLLLKSITELATEYNSSVIYALSPRVEDYSEKFMEFHEFEALFGGEKYEYSDLYNEVLNRTTEVKRLYLDHCHYSPAGNKLVAEIIYDRLESDGKLAKNSVINISNI